MRTLTFHVGLPDHEQITRTRLAIADGLLHVSETWPWSWERPALWLQSLAAVVLGVRFPS